MREKSSGPASSACLLAVLLAGCAVGPKFHRPAPPPGAAFGAGPLPTETASAPAPGGAAQRLVAGADIPGEWWRLFHSPELNALIEEALKNNADLAAARAGLRVAMENYRAERGAFLPAVSASAGLSRNRNAVETSPYLASGQLLYNLYQGQLAASWTLDLFGGNRRAAENLRAQAEAEQYQLESTYLALTANLVSAAVEEASLRAQVAATEDLVRLGAKNLDIFRRQQSLGQIAGADVAAQETALAQVEETLPPLRRQLEAERDLLAALVGRLPGEAPDPAFDFSALRLPEDVPLTLPSKLVDQRPDIRMAEANLHAASAAVGVAIANMLPNITLTANPGALGTTLNQVFASGSGFWSVGAGLTQPIFQGGTLLHREKAARAAYEQAAAQYRSTVITAFQNVADSLHALSEDADLFRAAARSEQAAKRSLDIARRQLELGSVSYLSLIGAEQAYAQARISLVQAEAARFSDTAALIQALGGGWWNRSDASTSSPPLPIGRR